jgi:hypothetical protein
MLATLRNDFFCSIFPFYNVTELAFEWPERLGPRGFLLSLLRFFLIFVNDSFHDRLNFEFWVSRCLYSKMAWTTFSGDVVLDSLRKHPIAPIRDARLVLLGKRLPRNT